MRWIHLFLCELILSEYLTLCFSELINILALESLNAENLTSHIHMIQSDRRMFRALSEIVGSSVLISSQYSFNH